MKKFHFGLEPLLRHRQRLVEQRRKVVAARIRELRGAQDGLRRLDQELADSTAELRKYHLRGPVDLAYLSSHRRYVNAMHHQIHRQMGKITEVRQRLDMERAALVTATRQARVLEQLRERKLAEYRKQLDRVRETESNEIGLNVFRRARRREVAAC